MFPALAEAMQTTPPIEMAKAKNAGAVQPINRNIAQVAMSVAMAMPEIGFEDVPISPVIREETVTNRKPKITTSSAAKKLFTIEVWAPATG